MDYKSPWEIFESLNEEQKTMVRWLLNITIEDVERGKRVLNYLYVEGEEDE